MSGRINDLVIKVLGISKLFKKIYVLMAYKPGGEYVVTAVFMRRSKDVRHVLDGDPRSDTQTT